MNRRLGYLLVGLLVFSLVFSFYLLHQADEIEEELAVESESLSVLMGGDVFFDERVADLVDAHGASYLVEDVISELEPVDLKLVNLEAPIVGDADKWLDKQHHLKQKPDLTLPLLKELGVDGVSLANNHILDYGVEGLFSTVSWLEQAGIKYAGAGPTRELAERPVFFERKSRKLAFLAFSNTYPSDFWASEETVGTAFGKQDRVEQQVAAAAETADHVIVSFHWGRELNKQPRSYQKDLGRASIEAGADVVFGHHPHVLQPVEKHEDGIIFYSLGNYFFTTLTDNVQYGLLPRVKLSDTKVEVTDYHLINVNNYQVDYRTQVVETFPGFAELKGYLAYDEERYKAWDDVEINMVYEDPVTLTDQ